MAQRIITETIDLSDDDIRAAITEWLHNHYGPPKIDMADRPEISSWDLNIVASHNGRDPDTVVCSASREILEPK